MSRREKIENIIIGTLLCSSERENYYNDCRSCIVEEMFMNEENRRIYHLIAQMNAQGKQNTDPFDILNEYGEAVHELFMVMVDRAVEFSFPWMRCMFNEEKYMAWVSSGTEPTYTDVDFIDYVKEFIKKSYAA